MFRNDIYFDTREYEHNHGRKPKGRGTWQFAFGNRDTVAVVSPSDSYAEAKRWAAAEAIDRGTSCVYVCT